MSNEIARRLATQNYPAKVYLDEDEKLYVIEFIDLPGCKAFGSTVDEAYKKAQEAKEEWLKLTLEQGLPLPQPSRTEEHSGRLLLRLPSSLHSMIADKAKILRTSLNQYVVHLLSAGVVGEDIVRSMEEVNARLDILQHSVIGLESHINQLASFVHAQAYHRTINVISTGMPSQLEPETYEEPGVSDATFKIVGGTGMLAGGRRNIQGLRFFPAVRR